MENPYAAPKSETPFELPPGAMDPQTADELRAIANYQRSIQYAILIQVGCYFALVGIGAMAGKQVGPAAPQFGFLGFAMMLGVAIGAIYGAIYAVLLALRVYNVVFAILFGFAAFIPCAGLLGLFVINQRATARLQEFDVPVGLLGADLQVLEERIQQRMIGGLPPPPAV